MKLFVSLNRSELLSFGSRLCPNDISTNVSAVLNPTANAKFHVERPNSNLFNIQSMTPLNSGSSYIRTPVAPLSDSPFCKPESCTTKAEKLTKLKFAATTLISRIDGQKKQLELVKR